MSFMVKMGEGGFRVPVSSPSSTNPFDILGTGKPTYNMMAPDVLSFVTRHSAEQMHGNMIRRWAVESLEVPYQAMLNQVGYKKDENGVLQPGSVRALILMGVPGLGKTQAGFFLSETLGYNVTVADCTNQTMSDLLVEVSVNGHTTKNAISRLTQWLESPDALTPAGKVITDSLQRLCSEKKIPFSFERDAKGEARLVIKLREMGDKEYDSQNDPLVALNQFAQANNLLSQSISVGLSKKDGPLLATLLRANTRGEKVQRIMENITDATKREVALKEVYEQYGTGDVIIIDEYTRRLREGIPHELYAVMAGTTSQFAITDASGATHVIEAKNLAHGNFLSVFACNTPTRQEAHETLPPSAAVLSRFTMHTIDNVSAVDFARAGERELTGTLLSNAYAMHGGADGLKTGEKQTAFYEEMLINRTAGLTPSEQLEFTRLQQTRLIHWGDTITACSRLGEFYKFWRDCVHDDSLFAATDEQGNPRIRPEIDPRNILKLFAAAQRGSLETISLADEAKHRQESGNLNVAAPEEIFGTRVREALIAEINRAHPDKKQDKELLKKLSEKLVECKIAPKNGSKAKAGDARSTNHDELLLEDLLNASPFISKSEELKKYQLVIAASMVARNHRNFPEGNERKITFIKPAAKVTDPFDPASYKESDLRALLPLHAVQEVLRQFNEAANAVPTNNELPVNVKQGLSLYAAMFTQGKDIGSAVVRPDRFMVIDPWNSDKFFSAEHIKKLQDVVQLPAELSSRQGVGVLAAMPNGKNILQSMLLSDAPAGEGKEPLYKQLMLNRSPYGVGVTTKLVDEANKPAEGLALLQDKTGTTKTYYNPIHLVSGPTGMVLVGSGDLPEQTKALMQQQGIHYFDRLKINVEKSIDAALNGVIDGAMTHNQKGNREELVSAIKIALNSRHTLPDKIGKTPIGDKSVSLGAIMSDVGEASKLALYLPVTETPETLAVMREIAASVRTTDVRKG